MTEDFLLVRKEQHGEYHGVPHRLCSRYLATIVDQSWNLTIPTVHVQYVHVLVIGHYRINSKFITLFSLFPKQLMTVNWTNTKNKFLKNDR